MYKYLLIDGNNFAWRAAYTISLSNRDGKNVSVMYGMLNMIRSLIEEHFPSEVCVCWDKGGSVAKKAIYPEYKQQRKNPETGTPPEIAMEVIKQIEDLQPLLPNFGLKQIQRQGVEADDLIGLLCEYFKDVLVVSSDKDLFQLVGKSNSVFYPVKNMIIDVNNFESVVGIGLDLYVDFRAIVGDPTDNIRGLPGFGEVTARKLLKKHGGWVNWFVLNMNRTLEVPRLDVLADVNSRQKSVLQSSARAQEILARNYALMKVGYLVQDIKEEVLNDFRNQEPVLNTDMVKSIFEENQFDSYMSKFGVWVHPFRTLEGGKNGM